MLVVVVLSVCLTERSECSEGTITCTYYNLHLDLTQKKEPDARTPLPLICNAS